MLARLLASFAIVETGQMADRLRRALRDYALVAAAGALGLGFLLLAAFIFLARRYGAIETSFGFGVGFLLIAGLVLAYHKISAARRLRRAELRRSTEVRTIAGTAAITALPLLMRGGLGAKAMLLPFVGLLAYAVLREQGVVGGGEDEELPEE